MHLQRIDTKFRAYYFKHHSHNCESEQTLLFYPLDARKSCSLPLQYDIKFLPDLPWIDMDKREEKHQTIWPSLKEQLNTVIFQKMFVILYLERIFFETQRILQSAYSCIVQAWFCWGKKY